MALAHRSCCHCHCHCQRRMYSQQQQAVTINNYQYHNCSFMAASLVAKTTPVGAAVRAALAKEKPKVCTTREPRPIANDKHLRSGMKNANDKHLRPGTKDAKSGEKHREPKQTAGGAANDKKVRESAHRNVKAEPKPKVYGDAKPKVKRANDGICHKH